MPKNPHADFTPSLEGYTGQGAFRFWCQMALPLTYDDSLSYYELLCKVVNYLNNIISDVSTVEDNVGALADAYTQLQNYVNNYFDELDIEEELRNVLDAMAEDGTLDELLSPLIDEKLPDIVDEKIDDVVSSQIDNSVAGQIDETVAEQLPNVMGDAVPIAVGEWLEENVDPVGSAVIVDKTLTIEGAAADAQVTGNNLNNLKTQINNITDKLPTNFMENKIITLNNMFDGQKLKLSAKITPFQEGSGTPSIENIRAITGWNKCDLRVTGINVWGGNDMVNDIYSAIPNANINVAEHTVSYLWNDPASKPMFTGFKESTRYTIILTFKNNSVARTNMQVNYSDGSLDAIPATTFGSKETTVFVTDVNKTVVSITKTGSGGTTTIYGDESGVFEGVRNIDYFKEYVGNSYVVNFNNTIYGGLVDYNDSKITISSGYIASYNGENLPGEWISDRDVYSPGTLPSIGAQVVYELSEYSYVSFEPITILSNNGTINIWANCGNVEYFYIIAVPNIDDTLSISGDAADAKITGDRLNTLTNDMNVLSENINQEINDINDKLPTDSVKESFLTLNNMSVNQKLKLMCEITAIQSGSGTPSGDNVRPITGFDYAEIRRTGFNVWGGLDMIDDIKSSISNANVDDSNHTVSYASSDTASGAFFTGFKPSTRYTIILTYRNNSSNRTNMMVRYTDNTTEPIPSNVSGSKETIVHVTRSGKSVAGIFKQGSAGRTTIFADESGVFEGIKTINDFVEYYGYVYKVPFNETIYGGMVDFNNGTITITKGYIASYDGENLPGYWISDRDVYNVGNVPTNGAQVVYDLEEPIVQDFTPIDVYSIYGTNIIWSNCGNVVYIYTISVEEYVGGYDKYVRTHMLYHEFAYGSIDTNGNNYATQRSIRTIGYIDNSIDGFDVIAGYKVAVCIYKPNGTFQRVAWIRNTTINNGMNYRFDHTNKYRIYIGLEGDPEFVDIIGPINAVTFYQDSFVASKRYNENVGKFKELVESCEFANNVLYDLMTDNYKLSYANAPKKLDVMSPYGNNQIVHPKVLYFENGLFGHKFWMAYTPYPFSETSMENPCIAYSEDGYAWTTTDSSPIDIAPSGFDSDTHLLYNPDTELLECWYRWYTNSVERIYRRTSSDGLTWSSAELLLESNSTDHYLSPAVYYDNGVYHIWTISPVGGYHIEYFTSSTGTNWTFVRNIDLTYTYGGNTYNEWHLDVIYDNNKYVMVVMCKYTTTKWNVFITTSNDNITYNTPEICIVGNPDSWDVKLYRSSIVKVGDEYRIYYSGLRGSYYGIGVTTSKTLDKFVGKLMY